MPPVMFPDTVRLVNVPTLVMFGCEFVVSVPVNKLAPIVPLFAYTLPDVVFPVTAKLVNVPRLVTLG